MHCTWSAETGLTGWRSHLSGCILHLTRQLVHVTCVPTKGVRGLLLPDQLPPRSCGSPKTRGRQAAAVLHRNHFQKQGMSCCRCLLPNRVTRAFASPVHPGICTTKEHLQTVSDVSNAYATVCCPPHVSHLHSSHCRGEMAPHQDWGWSPLDAGSTAGMPDVATAVQPCPKPVKECCRRTVGSLGTYLRPLMTLHASTELACCWKCMAPEVRLSTLDPQ